MEQTVKSMTASPCGFQKIGVFGGSYNPVHCGHLQIAEAAREQFGLDQVWFVPAWIQPFKQGMQVVSASHRRQMLELALEPYPDFRICDYELEKKGISYTCDTIQALKAAMPDTHLYFILWIPSVPGTTRRKSVPVPPFSPLSGTGRAKATNCSGRQIS